MMFGHNTGTRRFYAWKYQHGNALGGKPSKMIPAQQLSVIFELKVFAAYVRHKKI